MATLSNSWIRPWLDFDGAHFPSDLTCEFANHTIASCPDVCGNSTLLFDPSTRNLVTCGIWTSDISTKSYQFNGTIEVNNNFTSGSVAPFDRSGFTPENYGAAPFYAATISDCLESIYVNVKQYSFEDDGQVPAACTKEDLFPLWEDPNSTSPTTSSLHDCLDSICEPLTVNPDLAGVGVFWSFIIQAGIAIIALLALLVFDVWYSFKRIKEKVQIDRMIVALVDFHKAQCYFASVIQIAALTLFHKSKNGSAEAYNYSSNPHAFRDLFDSSVLIFLATCGLIPINLTLACITRYGRQSWYVLILSSITTILASATLIASYVYAHDYGKASFYENNVNSPYDVYNAYRGDLDYTCYIEGNLRETLIPLCGNSNLVKNQLPNSTIANWWTWLIYVNCIIWLFLSLGKKYYDSATGRSRRILTGLYSKHTWIQNFMTWLARERNARHAWILASVIPWFLCFASQFYLFSAYFRHEVISSEWGFGQIIAITVWIPSVVEYLYIQWNDIEKASKYKYPSPLMVMRHVARSSVSMANLQSPEEGKEGGYGFPSLEERAPYPEEADYHDVSS